MGLVEIKRRISVRISVRGNSGCAGHYSTLHKQRIVSISPAVWRNVIPVPKLVGGPTPARVTPKCLILNRRSVVKPGAIQTLQAELSTNEIDLRFTSETWLHDGFDINLVRLAGYTFLTKNGKDRIGGGVEIVCRNDWMMKKIDFKEKDFECLRVRITHKDDQQLYAAVL